MYNKSVKVRQIKSDAGLMILSDAVLGVSGHKNYSTILSLAHCGWVAGAFVFVPDGEIHVG